MIDSRKLLLLNKDDMVSIVLFLLVKAEIPDLISQLKLIQEFTSTDLQDSVEYTISNTFTMFYTTIWWLSALNPSMLSKDKTYLLKANVQIKIE